MSLSSESKTKNPAKKFLEWQGGIGVWRYYDKEKEENVTLDENLYIVPLDELSTIKGWHDASMSGIYSSEVKFLNDEELTVKSFKGGEIAKGLYKDIKGSLEGGKFCKSVYAAMLDSKGNVVELVNISFKGASLGVWIDANIKIEEGKILILSKNPEQQKKGATTYYIPKITVKDKNDKIINECVDMDKELQEYLGQYKKSNDTVNDTQSDTVPQEPAQSLEEDESLDLPF